MHSAAVCLMKPIKALPLKGNARIIKNMINDLLGINMVNMYLCYYAGVGQQSDSELKANNPVKYTDPTGVVLTRLYMGETLAAGFPENHNGTHAPYRDVQHRDGTRTPVYPKD